MKAALFLPMMATASLSALADDIIFTNKTASFTNLQGQVYQRVQLVRGDRDGLIWRSGASGGRICYTNLDTDLLASFGISSNRIEIARVRAQDKAIADARYRAQAYAQARAKLQQRVGSTNATFSVSWSNGPAVTHGPSVANGADYQYGAGVPYGPSLLYGVNPSTAPSAPSAPSAGSAATAPSAPGTAVVPSVASVPSAASASSAPLAAPTPSAHAAPPALVLPAAPRKGR